MALRRFSLISEVEARTIEPGTTVVLDADGHVTPLAADTLRERRVTVSRDGATDAALPADLAPVFPVQRVAIGADHTGVVLKSSLIVHLRRAGLAVTDCGTDGPASVDYPDMASAVGKAVARGEVDAGVVIDGAGLGSAMAANKVRGVRAAMCLNVTLARYAREHNGANVLALGSTLVTTDEAIQILDTWLATRTKEARYLRRLMKVRRMEERF